MTFEDMYYTKDGKGKVVLFLHGWGCDGSIWKSQRAYLAKCGYCVICVDLDGFGNSPPPPFPYSIYDYADKIARFIEHLDINGVIIVAHSFGGRIATVLAATQPNIVSCLVLIGAAGVKNRKVKVTLKIILYKCAKVLSKIGLFNINSLAKMGSRDYRACNGVMRCVMSKATKLSTVKYMRQIACPTLLIWGELDTETPLTAGKIFLKNIRNSALVTLKSGHFCFCEQPREVNLILSSFLSSV